MILPSNAGPETDRSQGPEYHRVLLFWRMACSLYGMQPIGLVFIAVGLLLGQEPSTITPPATPGAPTPPPAVAPEQPGPAPDGSRTAKPVTSKPKPRKHRGNPTTPASPTTAKQPPQPA